jgi:hypothetical protein
MNDQFYQSSVGFLPICDVGQGILENPHIFLDDKSDIFFAQFLKPIVTQNISQPFLSVNGLAILVVTSNPFVLWCKLLQPAVRRCKNQDSIWLKEVRNMQ